MYVSMIGRFGCYPDNSEDHDSYEGAIAYLADTLEIEDSNLVETLRQEGYLRLPPTLGADYCEIATC